MAKAKQRTVQIRSTLLDEEGLSSRVNTEAIQYEFIMAVISSMTMEVDKNPNTLFLLACKATAIM
jgi:hypothetical protein